LTWSIVTPTGRDGRPQSVDPCPPGIRQGAPATPPGSGRAPWHAHVRPEDDAGERNGAQHLGGGGLRWFVARGGPALARQFWTMKPPDVGPTASVGVTEGRSERFRLSLQVLPRSEMRGRSGTATCSRACRPPSNRQPGRGAGGGVPCLRAYPWVCGIPGLRRGEPGRWNSSHDPQRVGDVAQAGRSSSCPTGCQGMW